MSRLSDYIFLNLSCFSIYLIFPELGPYGPELWPLGILNLSARYFENYLS